MRITWRRLSSLTGIPGAHGGRLAVTEQRLTASVTLIQSIGGGWDEGKLPQSGQVEDDTSFLHMVPVTNDHPTSSDEPAKAGEGK